MPRSRNSRNNWVDTLPADWWEREPKVYLYRIDPRRVWQYLGVFLADYFDEGFVASRFGGGDFWYRAVYKGRTWRTEMFSIEGPPKPVPGSSMKESRPVRRPSSRNRR